MTRQLATRSRQLPAGVGRFVSSLSIVTLLFVPAARPAIAGVYTFTKIADLATGPYTNFLNGQPAINANGQVVFHANLPAPPANAQGIFMGDGVSACNVANNSPGSPFLTFITSAPAVNASGTVAYWAQLSSLMTGIFADSCRAPSCTVASAGGSILAFGLAPSINASGTVVFSGVSGGMSGVFTAAPNCGPLTPIATLGGMFTGFGNSPVINDAGTVAFRAFISGGNTGIFSVTGGIVTTIATGDGGGPSPFSSVFNCTVINAGGTVAFFASLDSGVTGIFTGNGGPTATIVLADGSGPLPFASIDGCPSINASGAVVFTASTDAGLSGIFDGPDPVANVVIDSGSTLFGSGVVFPVISRLSLNDNGQIAFRFGTGGNQFVGRADASQACCFPTGACSMITAADCAATGGTPQGPGSTCSAVPDCNGNGQPDACDIASGGSIDANNDGIPDECVSIVAANPPTDNPFIAGQQPFRDVLQDLSTGPTPPAGTPQGIGGAGTPTEGAVTYSPISVTFSGTPTPAPVAGNVAVACTGGICPSVTTVAGGGSGPYMITLSAPIPPGQCTTLTFAGTAAGAKLQYQSQPGNVNLDAATNTQDLLALIQALNNGQANLSANLARYNVNRSTGVTPVNTQDLLRLIQLLNGTNATQAFNGATVAACP